MPSLCHADDATLGAYTLIVHMRVTVCELSDDSAGFARDWDRLARHVHDEKSELVLLPEMPFFPWFANEPNYDDAT